MAVSSDWSISAENWRTAAKVSLREVTSDPASLEVCNCGLPKPAENIVDLTKDSNVVSSDEESTVSNIWLSTPLYTFRGGSRSIIMVGW